MIVSPLKWPETEEEIKRLRANQHDCLMKARRNVFENRVWKRLKKQPYKWHRQVLWGYRIFDFFCIELGAAIEIDGSYHNIRYDSYRDESLLQFEGIKTIRMVHLNYNSIQKDLECLPSMETWEDRRKSLGLEWPCSREPMLV